MSPDVLNAPVAGKNVLRRTIMAYFWNEYQKNAWKLAVKEVKRAGLGYTALGIINENYELCEKLTLFVCADQIREESVRNKIRGEIGDVLWYIAGTCTALNIELFPLMKQAKKESELGALPFEYQDFLNYFLSEIRRINAKVAALAKKIIRKDSDKGKKRQELSKTLISNIRILLELCRILDCTLKACASANLDKLASRANRGLIKGSGDNR